MTVPIMPAEARTHCLTPGAYAPKSHQMDQPSINLWCGQPKVAPGRRFVPRGPRTRCAGIVSMSDIPDCVKAMDINGWVQ